MPESIGTQSDDRGQIALLFDEDDAARQAAELAGVEVVLLDEDYSKKTGYYGFDPHTYRHDVMPIVAAIVLPDVRIEALQAEGEHLGELGRTSPESLVGWERRAEVELSKEPEATE
jgi:hypothetical protein